MLISTVGIGCAIGAAVSHAQYADRYFELLVICAVLLIVGSEIIAAIGRSTLVRQSLVNDPFQAAEIERLLKSIDERLVGVRLSIQNLEPAPDWTKRR